MVYGSPQKLEIVETIFDDLASSSDNFEIFVRKHYTAFCYEGSYEPQIHEACLKDAHAAFCRDKENMPNSLPDSSSTPDHFKMAGVLVYWLRRFAPVYELRSLNLGYPSTEDLRELLEKYPSELLAFEFGFAICHYFESEKEGNSTAMPAIDANSLDFYKTICYMMKFKNMSPHSLGAVYRALYVPLLPQ